jgi:hypothetical protein
MTTELALSSADAANAVQGVVPGAPTSDNLATSATTGSATASVGGPAIALDVALGKAGAQPMQGVEPADGTQQGGGLEVGAANQERTGCKQK